MFDFLQKKKLPITLTVIAFAIGLVILLICVSQLHRFSINQNPSRSQSPTNLTANDLFLQALKNYIAAPQEQNELSLIQAFSHTDLPRETSGVFLTIYQPPVPIIRIFSTRITTEQKILRTAKMLASHKRAGEFSLNDPDSYSLQLDFVTSPPVPVDINSLCDQCLDDKRFEPGVDGFETSVGDKKKFFLPGDAFVLSIYSLKPVIDTILRKWQNIPKEQIHWSRLHTLSFVSYKNTLVELYRGIPVIGNINTTDLKKAIAPAIAHTIKYQKPDGTFLYYYDAAADSFIDHEHPDRDPVDNPYYNDLRHCGGTLMLLQDYERTKNKALLEPIRRSIKFSVSLIKKYHLPSGKNAGYAYYNKKAKLGGSGIVLYTLAEYQRITGDTTFAPAARLLHRHLMAQILPSGEFMYYSLYLEKLVPPEENRNHFSFYYPGEAIIGLTQYAKILAATSDEKNATLLKIKTAMRFLLEERPKQYTKEFTTLPSDSWLMMAINELWDIPETRDASYAAFVFADADKMVTMMYTKENALYPDYPGSFFYQHGDLPYADGARAEGLLAAAYLAKKTGDTARFSTYLAAAKQAAWALMHLVNTPEAMYFAPRPSLAVGGVRFKHTRQWFRIDSTMHVISFYLKLLPLWIE
ncbi:MAG: hypothetical protein HQL22_11425 [Candidatus Omnitrophica bacterium]|nr:hypothetical protein [Candidatus Omnitrophota bacterium]